MTHRFPPTAVTKRELALGLTVLLLAGLFAGRHLSDWPVKLRYPSEQSYGEGVQLAVMVHLREGAAVYALPTNEKFDAAIYGPLYYLFGARLVDPQAPAYLPLRLLSLFGTLGCAAGCSLLAFWTSRSILSAVLGPLIFLSFGFVTNHGLSARPDLVALLLCFSGFLVAYRFRQSRGLLAAVPLMVLGIYYKQQFVAGPIAVFLYLLLEKRYRLAAQFAGLMALGGATLLGTLEWAAFPGQAFLTHFVAYNLLPFSLLHFLLGLAHFGLTFVVPLLMGLEFLRVHADRLLRCYLGCAVALALLSFARPGSDSNYFLECTLLLSALVAALVARNLSGPLSVSELLVLLGITLFFAQWFARPAPRAEDFARDRAMQQYLRDKFPRHALALGPFPGDFVRAGLGAPVCDLFQYAQLIRSGKLSDTDLLAQLRERRFAVIVADYELMGGGRNRTRGDRLPQSWTEAIVQNYQPVATLEMPAPQKFLPEDRYYIWVPGSRLESSQPASPR